MGMNRVNQIKFTYFVTTQERHCTAMEKLIYGRIHNSRVVMKPNLK